MEDSSFPRYRVVNQVSHEVAYKTWAQVCACYQASDYRGSPVEVLDILKADFTVGDIPQEKGDEIARMHQEAVERRLEVC